MSAVICVHASMELASLAVNADLDRLVQTSPVEFVGGLDARYMCVQCRATLRQPCQAPCGHRICRPCADALFAAADDSRLVRCPGNEEDCADLTRDVIRPDFSAMRDMKALPVYCTNCCRGCQEQPLFGKLKEHLNSCKFNLKKCSYCAVEISAIEQDVAEHEQQCPRRPHKCKFDKIGCTFEAPKSEMGKHENDAAGHLMLALEYLVIQQQSRPEQRQTADNQQTVEADLMSTRAQLMQFAKENSDLKSTVQILTTNIELLKSTVSSQSKTLETLKSKLSVYESNNERQSHELQKMKSSQQELMNGLKELAQRAATSSTALPEELRKQLITYDRAVGQHDMRLSELDLRCQCLETANYDGVLVWKISDYLDRKRQAVEGRVLSLYSQPFYTSRYGYKMCARVYLNGDGTGRNTHLSLFFVVMQGDYDDLLSWPFRQRVTLSLLDQRQNKRPMQDSFRPDPTSASFQKPRTPMNVASGCPTFVSHATLEDPAGPFLVNNLIYVRVTVDTADLLNP